MTRRKLLTRIAAAYSASHFALASNEHNGAEPIMRRIKAPMFPKRDFDVTQYGAAGDGRMKCTEAIRKAIQACSAAGGGHVVIPKGVFLSPGLFISKATSICTSPKRPRCFSVQIPQIIFR